MNFEDAYKRLNVRQRDAVDTIEGPVMVVAGPGTGKTQVLGARVANILAKTDSMASNILCLTFTDAATIALRKRLVQFIGSEAHRVNIYTYHGFCNMVIQENKELFGIQGLEPVSKLEVLEVLKEIIDELPNGHILKRYTGEQYYDITGLQKLFSYLKRENIALEKLHQLVQVKLENFKEDPSNYYTRKSGEFKKGDFKVNAFNQLTKKLEKLKAAAALLGNYNQKLKKRRRYDFNDMILWIIEAFSTHEDVLLTYQEKYHYFLVDEYQDTNGSQNDLLYLLINYWERPNVFVVGDDDQSIYKFQGANVENVYEFYAKYIEHIKLITLTENYRSTQQILNVSNHVIGKNTERLVNRVAEVEKTIVASLPAYKDLPIPVKVNAYPNTAQETIDIAAKVIELNKKGVPFNEIAILYKEHKQSYDLIRYFQTEGIPYNVVKSQNVLDEPLVIQLINILTYVSNELESIHSGENLLFEILHYNQFEKVNAIDIARISRAIYNSRKKWRDELLSANFSVPDVSSETLKEIRQFMQDVEYWIKQSKNMGTQSLIEKIMSKAGFIGRALASHESAYLIECLKTFFNFIKAETARLPFGGLASILEKVSLMKSNNLSLPVKNIVRSSNGVNFMTVYGSKGLEFEHVFLIGCTNAMWLKKSRALPFNLSSVLTEDAETGREEEARRLFYVALTRAKKEFSVSFAKFNENGKAFVQSLFVIEAQEESSVETTEIAVDQDQFNHFFGTLIDSKNQEFQELTEQGFIQSILDNFRINATNLNSYLRCPIAFFYQNIIRIPGAKNESMTFGTAMHDSLERFFAEKNKSGQFPTKESLYQSFFNIMFSSRESFTQESFERKLYYGKETLHAMYDEYIERWNAFSGEVGVELSIKNTEFDGIPIRGKIDKVEIFQGSANVVDYKTGKYTNGKKKIKPPVAKLKEDESDHNKIYGGDYWRQILFYKLLIDSDPTLNYNVISGTVDFVEPDEKGFHQEKIMINDKDYATLKGQVKLVYGKIMNKEFSNGCEKDDCQWCSFQSYYNRQKLLKLEIIEGSDDAEMEER